MRKFEERKVAKGLKSVLKDAQKYAEELNIACVYEETKTTMTNEGRTMEVEQPSPKLIAEFLTTAVNNSLTKEVSKQKWLGAFTSLQYEDSNISTDSSAVLQKWQNIPDVVYNVNTSIRQQN